MVITRNERRWDDCIAILITLLIETELVPGQYISLYLLSYSSSGQSLSQIAADLLEISQKFLIYQVNWFSFGIFFKSWMNLMKVRITDFCNNLQVWHVTDNVVSSCFELVNKK